MHKIRLTKQFDFEAAHALDGYDGKCKDIHGHSYHLKVTILGIPLDNPKVSACGMVLDFSDLKGVVKKHIIDEFDHKLILREDSRFRGIEKDNKRVRYVSYQPTCENMLLEMVDIVKKQLPAAVQLKSILLRETANSYAEWFAEDN